MDEAIIAGHHVSRSPVMLAPADRGSGIGATEKPSILIVEDDFLVATDVENALRDAGYRVVGIAVSGSEAIALAKTHRPTIAVMDVRLVGDRDGVDTAIELFREHNIRCVFATAHSDPETRMRGSSASPLGWLAKPYNPDALVEMLKRALSD